MPCGGCGRRSEARREAMRSRDESALNGGYANLTARQIKARLEVYKRRYCSKCEKRYDCNYNNYLKCKGK